jgi:DNA replication licensing factor MCM7
MNGKLNFISGSSKFVAFQTLKIQETSDQLIEGNIPRTFLVHLRGEICRQASPGDVVMIQGVLLPNRRDGFRHRGELIFDSYIEVYKVTREKKKYIDMAISQETRQ